MILISEVCGTSYFYPRPPRGGRHSAGRRMRTSGLFLSTPSARRATKPVRWKYRHEEISIHALREEGDLIVGDVNIQFPISIHALREEGDVILWLYQQEKDYFYPRPPRGGRPRQGIRGGVHADFYPRPPRGGRRSCNLCSTLPRNFYPRPPRGGRPEHTPRKQKGDIFLSTPSARRATQNYRKEE